MRAEKYTVFISHSAEDAPIVKLLVPGIKAVDADCRIDYEFLRIGQPFHPDIVKNIRQCHEMLVLYTPKFKVSRWLDHEVGIALGAGLHVCAIIYDLVLDDINKCEFLRNCHAASLNDFQTHYLPQLEQRVERARYNDGAEKIRALQDEITRVFSK